MEDQRDVDKHREAYVREVLRLYVGTPGVLGHVRRADRELAGRLFDQRVPLHVIHRALILAAARRIHHNAFTTPLPPIRSLHYFIEPIREVIERPPGPRDIDALRHVLAEYARR